MAVTLLSLSDAKCVAVAIWDEGMCACMCCEWGEPSTVAARSRSTLPTQSDTRRQLWLYVVIRCYFPSMLVQTKRNKITNVVLYLCIPSLTRLLCCVLGLYGTSTTLADCQNLGQCHPYKDSSHMRDIMWLCIPSFIVWWHIVDIPDSCVFNLYYLIIIHFSIWK